MNWLNLSTVIPFTATGPYWATGTSRSINQGVALLLALVLLLGLFFIGVVILNIARQRRRTNQRIAAQAQREAESPQSSDPWYEAGRRASGDPDGPSEQHQHPQ